MLNEKTNASGVSSLILVFSVARVSPNIRKNRESGPSKAVLLVYIAQGFMEYTNADIKANLLSIEVFFTSLYIRNIVSIPKRATGSLALKRVVGSGPIIGDITKWVNSELCSFGIDVI